METQVNRRNPKWSWSRFFLALGLAGALAGAFFWGRFSSFSEATAAPPADTFLPRTHEPAGKGAAPMADSDYSQRVVAYINGNTKLTREDLGEYLIARQGAERVDLFVNRRIIENACKQKGVVVSEAEIEATLAEDLKSLGNIPLKDFVNNVLHKYQKTLYEWKEDVIWPKLALRKLVLLDPNRIKPTDKDVQMAFEAYHGEKVRCKMILWPPADKNRVLTGDIYPKIRDNAEEFDRVAKTQADARLATQQGKLPPFGRYSTGNAEMERAAFALQRDEVSHVIETPQGLIVLKCLEHIPPEKGVTLEAERPKLEKEIEEKKLQLEIPKLFKELKDQARPQIFLTPKQTTAEDIEREVRGIQTPANPAAPIQAPHGN